MRSGIPESETATRTFRRYREGILNGHEHDKTNATAEGFNNTIKLPEKASYGRPTFSRMRRRCPFALGYRRPSRGHARLPRVDAGDEARKRGGDDDAAVSLTRKQPDDDAGRTEVVPLSVDARPRRTAVMPLA